MADGSVSYNQNDTIEEVCSQLQSSLQLDPEHLKIANIACKYIAEAPDAAVVFSNGAFHQLGVPKTVPPPNSTAYAYDVTFKEFVRETARIILLKPTIEAYSNNPNNNGTLPKSLYYLTLVSYCSGPTSVETTHDHSRQASVVVFPADPRQTKARPRHPTAGQRREFPDRGPSTLGPRGRLG